MINYPEQIKSNVVGRHIAGWTPTRISTEFKIPRTTVRGWIEQFKKGTLTHTHHWIIPPPVEQETEAKCRYCEQVSIMSNYLDMPSTWPILKKKKKELA